MMGKRLKTSEVPTCPLNKSTAIVNFFFYFFSLLFFVSFFVFFFIAVFLVFF